MGAHAKWVGAQDVWEWGETEAMSASLECTLSLGTAEGGSEHTASDGASKEGETEPWVPRALAAAAGAQYPSVWLLHRAG